MAYARKIKALDIQGFGGARTGWTPAPLTWQFSGMRRPLHIRKLSDRLGDYVLVITCRKCNPHAADTAARDRQALGVGHAPRDRDAATSLLKLSGQGLRNHG
jgi:hypothetical protein